MTTAMTTGERPEIHTAYALVEQRLGVRAAYREGSVTSVDTTPVTLVPNNPSRVALLVVNLHTANNLYIRPLAQPTASSGILLAPGGGYMLWVAPDDLVLPSLEWYALASGASTPVFVLEGIAD